MLSKRKELRAFVHKKLIFRLRRLAVFFICILSFDIYEITHNHIAPYIALGACILGISIGSLVGQRMHTISWDAETRQTVSRMDRIGVIILIGYLLFALGRRWIFGHVFHGYELTAFTLSFSAGSMAARIWHTRTTIRKILKQEGYLHPAKNQHP